MYFANNGSYFDPYSVSTVYILPDAGRCNGSPEIYLALNASDVGTSGYGLLNVSSLSSVLATFDVSNGGVIQPESAYDPTTSAASAIYHPSSVSAGHYGVVADNIPFAEFSTVGNYFDAWLVQDFSGQDVSSGWHLYVNKFSVFNDRIITYTEPFQITSHAKLSQKYLQLSSIVTLRIETEQFMANEGMGKDLKNIWRESVLENASVRIRKRNPQTTGLITDVVDWTDTDVDVTSGDTILYTWNTSGLSTGDYIVQAKYSLLEQTFYTEEFSLVLR